MRNKGFVVVLTTVVTLLCLYYLSFTFVSRGIQKDATAYGTDSNGNTDLIKKQNYLDSIWNKPVYNFLGLQEFTYQEVKNNAINLGLDLQGGMHVTLEVSPVEIIKSLTGNRQDSAFVNALNRASALEKRSDRSFTDLFFETYRQANPNKRLAPLFSTAATRDRISINDSDEEVMAVVEEEVENAIDRSLTILKNRIDQFGTTQPNIQRLTGTDRIQIEVPGADNPQRIRKLLQGVAKLEFWDVIEPNAINSSLMAINDLLAAEAKAKSPEKNVDETKTESLQDALSPEETQPDSISDLEKSLENAAENPGQSLDSLQNLNVSPLFSLSEPPGYFRYQLKDTAVINDIFDRADVRNLLPRNVGVFWGNKPDKFNSSDANEKASLQLYFLDLGRNKQAKLSGEAIVNARTDLDEKGQPAVSMTMNATGTRIWAKWTAEAAINRSRIAIALDNLVFSAPYVNSEIPNGNSIIQGNFTTDEAKDLANILEAGSLPAPTVIVEEAVVGPTLGQLAQQQGFISIVCGLALVVIFMIAYYAKGGFVANLTLLFNIFFIMGILAQPSLGTALTLPGIAGIVLTMGMAVDANVLIFERIKEELAIGRNIKDAVSLGYKHAFSSIFDSNLTTLITGFFLFLLGQGPIKGFATTLMIGIITSFFSAIFISRIIVEWMVRKNGRNISLTTPIAKLIKKRRYFSFVENRRPAYLLSAAVIVIGLVLLFIQGVNLGVDFKGGRSYLVSFNQPVSATDLKVDLAKSFDNQGVEVKNYGGNNVMKVTTSYLIAEESEEADQQVRQALISGIESIYPQLEYSPNESQVDDGHFTISGSSKVGASIADDIKDSAWQASFFSLLGIFVYIMIRFRKWQYSAGAIIALVHDTLFVFAAYAIASLFGLTFEIDQVFVAAILTIIGYSINDTVIIFDRIREFIHMGTSHDRKKIFNDAMNATLSRTFITSGTTLMVVLILFIFGGEVLRGFSFALMVGMAVGTYSSLFIAAPVVLDFDPDKQTKSVAGKKAVPAH
jgi:SecD/SecF fusion protein